MAFPEKLLASDEEVVLHLHPHWKKLVVPILVFLLVAGAYGFAAATVDITAVQIALAVVAVALIVWFSIRPAIVWAATHFVVTTHRVLLRHGVLSRSGRDVPLARINDVSFEHSLFERMLGCGTLTVESAGERGQLVLEDIPRVEFVQSTLYQLVEDDDERRASPRGSLDGDGT
jgi:uncharacterized membrane protein YdbT with pleckstrin-like domain